MNTTAAELHLIYFYLSREMAKSMYAIQKNRLSPASAQYQSQMKQLKTTRDCLDKIEQEMARQLGDVSDLIKSIRSKLDLGMKYVYGNRPLDPNIPKQDFEDNMTDFQRIYQQLTGRTFIEEEAQNYTFKLMKQHGILP